jgi:hypothetical protein
MQTFGLRRSWCVSSTGWTKQLEAQEWFKKAPTLRLRRPHTTNSAAGGSLQKKLSKQTRKQGRQREFCCCGASYPAATSSRNC